jgi:histidine triad (HIT) family protein
MFRGATVFESEVVCSSPPSPKLLQIAVAPPLFAMTLFERIAARQIPAEIVFEDDLVLAFRDINPQAPVHVLIVPKRQISRINEATADEAVLLGHLLLKAAEVARTLGLTESGFRLVINNGRDGGETVPHLHCHLLGGRPLAWPPG